MTDCADTHSERIAGTGDRLSWDDMLERLGVTDADIDAADD